MLLDERGKPVGAVNVGEDITEHTQAEQALQRRNLELAALNAVAQTLSASLGLQDLLDRALSSTVSALGFAAGCINLADEHTGNLALASHTGLPLPLAEHLFVVLKGSEHITKCVCGHEFGDYRQNWKFAARVYVRDTRESLRELYRAYEHCDPEWMELREFYCPGCYALLEVEAVPAGYPVIQDFLPDLEGFYKDILGRDLPS